MFVIVCVTVIVQYRFNLFWLHFNLQREHGPAKQNKTKKNVLSNAIFIYLFIQKVHITNVHL